jgi:hypothetical protein
VQRGGAIESELASGSQLKPYGAAALSG